MIVGAAPYFNRKGVSTLTNFGIVALVVDISLIIALSMPLPLILTIKASLAAGTSTEGVFLGAGQSRLEDVFANLILGRASLLFPYFDRGGKAVHIGYPG
jgi:hypothetical protein